MIRRIFVQAVLTIMMCMNAVQANNNLFRPGDAFFPTRLTEDDFDRSPAEMKEGPEFVHSALGGYEGAFCGYAGYNRARFKGVDERFMANLKRAYRHVRANYESKELSEEERGGKRLLVETNGVGVLFYPPEFDFPMYRIGLQYNENWTAEVAKFAHGRRNMRLCCLVNTADAVMECWRDAELVAGLKAELPQVELKPVPPTEEPVIVHGAVKAFVVDSRPLSMYFDPPPDADEDISLLSVDSNGITELTYKDGEWVANKIQD